MTFQLCDNRAAGGVQGRRCGDSVPELSLQVTRVSQIRTDAGETFVSSVRKMN